MKPQNVDLLLVVDASESMKPCVSQLSGHLLNLLPPSSRRIPRFDPGSWPTRPRLLPGGLVYDQALIGGSGPVLMNIDSVSADPPLLGGL